MFQDTVSIYFNKQTNIFLYQSTGVVYGIEREIVVNNDNVYFSNSYSATPNNGAFLDNSKLIPYEVYGLN